MHAHPFDSLAVFDLETTGIDVESSRIVTACIAVLDAGDRVEARWDWLADPGVPIPEGAAAVHGITTERARAEGRDARTVVAEVAQTLRVLLGMGLPLVIYNAPYDLSLLDRECRRHGIEPLHAPSPVIDPLVIDKAVDRYRKGKRTLVAAAERYEVILENAHDAGADAIAAGLVARAIARAYPEECGGSLHELHSRQQGWYAEQSARFQDYMRTTRGETGFTASTEWPMRSFDTAVPDAVKPVPAAAPGGVGAPQPAVPLF